MSLLNKLASITANSAKRVGRGYGSGKGGHTAGRGVKGQKSRAGGKTAIWFEGGQLPLIKRMPMWRGKGRFNVVRPTAEITLTDLQNMQAEAITLDTLKLEKVIDHRFAKAKIVATGKLERKIVLEGTGKGLRVSKGAQAAIEKTGGSVK